MGEQVDARLYGGVAQLGEHLPCKQGVKSSNLSISIRSDYLIGNELYLYNASREQVHSIVCRHTITSKHNALRNAGIPHDSVFDVALYLENRIWKIQNIKWLNRKILTMPIETSEEVIFKKVTTKRIVKV